MACVIVSPKAREDLVMIHRYICDELQNPEAAFKLMSEMKAKILSLSDMPERGSALDTYIPKKTGFHFLLCGTYKIFFMCSQDTVEVVRILNNRQSYMKALFDS